MSRPLQQAPKERGQALVEFALTLPILLMLVFGIMDLARVMFAYTQVVDASRQAIRYGIVEGLSAPYNQYFDCEGIRDAALDLPGIITLDPTVLIKYHYQEEVQDPVSKDVTYRDAVVNCNSSLTAEFFSYRYSTSTMPMVVMEVEVKGAVQPLTPVLMPFTSSFDINYTSSRTIVFEGADYTYEWLTPPDQPTNFEALWTCECNPSDPNYADCVTNPMTKISFTWTPLSPIPERIEIRSPGVRDPVKVLYNWPTNLCDYTDDCASIEKVNGFGSYYMVAFVGKSPLELASLPSNTVSASCPPSPWGAGSESISGLVWNDADGDGVVDEARAGINGVAMQLVYTGADEFLNTVDDEVFPAVTAKSGPTNGVFNFGGLIHGVYYVQVVEIASPPLTGMSRTTQLLDPVAQERVELIAGDKPETSVNFGYWVAP